MLLFLATLLIPANHYPLNLASEIESPGWIGLFVENGSASVRPVTLTTRREPLCDENKPELFVETVPKGAVAVFRGIPGIKPRNVARIDVEELPAAMHLGQRGYSLRLERDSDVVLREGKKTQVLYSTGGSADDPHFTIIYAGDLDGDGRLDLLTNFSRKYSVNPMVLWLSSKAKNGEIVGEAARVELVAC